MFPTDDLFHPILTDNNDVNSFSVTQAVAHHGVRMGYATKLHTGVSRSLDSNGGVENLRKSRESIEKEVSLGGNLRQSRRDFFEFVRFQE